MLVDGLLTKAADGNSSGSTAGGGANNTAVGVSLETIPVVSTKFHLLFGVFGVAPWIVASALFAQLPLVLPKSPQGAHLASLMDVTTNCGNLVMLVFVTAANHTAIGRCQNMTRVSAPAKRAVNNDVSILGCQGLKNLGHHDRNMSVDICHQA